MPIHIDCPICGLRLKVPNFAAGRITKCSGCGNAVRVPQPTEMLAEGSKGDTAAKATKTSKRETPQFSLSEFSPRLMERLSAWLDTLAERPARIAVVALIFVACVVGAKTAKWALSKSTEPTPLPSVEAVDPEPWEGVGGTDANEKVRVTLVSSNTEQVVTIPSDSKLARKTPKAYSKVVLKIENLGPGPLKYNGWSPRADNNQAATLKDDTGASYEQPTWDARVVDQLGTATIPAGKSVEELLVFAPFAPYARYLKLALPAEACEGTGTLRIKIPHTRFVD